jgi:hypothetical protein
MSKKNEKNEKNIEKDTKPKDKDKNDEKVEKPNKKSSFKPVFVKYADKIKKTEFIEIDEDESKKNGNDTED